MNWDWWNVQNWSLWQVMVVVLLWLSMSLLADIALTARSMLTHLELLSDRERR
jgi:hypothetical protein